MPTPDLRNKDQPVGPLRDRLVIDTSGTDDYELGKRLYLPGCRRRNAGVPHA